jgi:hypothetical protein
VFYGLDWIATVPLATLAFGRERANVMFGGIVPTHLVGAGYRRLAEGHYDHAFLLSATLFLVAAFGVLATSRGRRPAVAAP